MTDILTKCRSINIDIDYSSQIVESSYEITLQLVKLLVLKVSENPVTNSAAGARVPWSPQGPC